MGCSWSLAHGTGAVCGGSPDRGIAPLVRAQPGSPKKPLQTLEFEFSNTENGPACFYLPWAAPGRLHTGPVRFVAGLRTQGHSPLSGRSQAASAPDQSNQPPPWWSKIRFAGSPVAVGVSGDVPVHLLGPGVHTGCVVGVVC